MRSAPSAGLPKTSASASRSAPASKQAATRPVGKVGGKANRAAADPPQDVHDRILATACALFYERGVRAVGVDLIVQEAAVAKTSLYRYFPTKDDLIVAFLEREDLEFWAQWDRVARQRSDDPAGELDAHMRWIGERLARTNYRGCPQINVAAEFGDRDHPARRVSQRHMQALRTRLQAIAEGLHIRKPKPFAAQLALLVNGAFVSSGLLSPAEATAALRGALGALLTAARADE